MKKTFLKVLAGAGLGGAAFWALQKGAANRVVEMAMARRAPKNMEENKKKAAGADEHIQALQGVRELAVKLEQTVGETVEIQAGDGVTLVGHYYHCENAKRVIVAMHGWRSSWARDFCGAAWFFHENECSVLYAEQRGQNASGGEYMGFGVLERHDCQAWAEYVAKRTGEALPIYLVGISMGATTVMMAAGLALPRQVRGIIADCGFTSPEAIWRHVLQGNMHIPYRLVAASVDRAYRKIVAEGASYSCRMALEQSRVPVLLIHGTDDKFVPVEMTYENYKACAGPKHLLVVPGAEHGMSYVVDKEGYERAIREFWAAYDREE